MILSLAALIADAAPPDPAPSAAPPKPATAPSAAPSPAQLDAGEPRANTSPTAGNAVEPASPDTAAARATDAPSRTGTSSRAAKPTGQKTPGTADRLDLGTATVTGDREQPKVMYIVPWSSADVGNLSGKPMNSLVDEALAPIDRDEFKREVRYFGAFNADRTQTATAKPPADQGAK
jgi:hypothetical protein